MEKKKTFVKPTLRVVETLTQTNLLSNSGVSITHHTSSTASDNQRITVSNYITGGEIEITFQD